MHKKLRVGVLCGGQSAEHEVSLQSARNIIEAMDREKFEPVLIGIDKKGTWHLVEAGRLLEAANPREVQLANSGELVEFTPNTAHQPVDVVFPIVHGPNGEDGATQGLLRLANIPFVGSDVLGSAAGMDKDVMKRLLEQAGIPIARFITVRFSERASFAAERVAHLGWPLFVKPSNMGSSVGVSKVANETELMRALDEAFRYDTKVLIEEAVVGREVECAVLGNENPEASVVGEIVLHSAEFYSYDAKYLTNEVETTIPADLPEKVAERVRELAVKTFQVLECSGLARVDCFVRTSDQEVLVNEINTLPGFTNISMYPKLWEASGISYRDLITKLLELALERHQQRQHLSTSFISAQAGQ